MCPNCGARQSKNRRDAARIETESDYSESSLRPGDRKIDHFRQSCCMVTSSYAAATRQRLTRLLKWLRRRFLVRQDSKYPYSPPANVELFKQPSGGSPEAENLANLR